MTPTHSLDADNRVALFCFTIAVGFGARPHNEFSFLLILQIILPPRQARFSGSVSMTSRASARDRQWKGKAIDVAANGIFIEIAQQTTIKICLRNGIHITQPGRCQTISARTLSFPASSSNTPVKYLHNSAPVRETPRSTNKYL